MRKVVSTIEGYTLLFEKNRDLINCVAFETDKNMSGQDIADSLDISRVAVSQNLKKSLKKIYRHLKIRNRLLSPFDITLLMTDMLNIKTEVQHEKFFRLLDGKIKKEICRDVKKGYCRY